MQELTSAICKSIDISSGEVEGRLRDTRDDKVYWVAKLKDNNCWMTQNLDYDGGGTLTPIASSPSSGDATLYYDLGDYILTTSGEWKYCDGIKDGLYNSACLAAGWQAVPSNYTEEGSGWVPT